MLWCNVTETAPLLTHNCWWNIFYGLELHEILQNSSNEEYIENKHSEGSNVEIDKEADETEESAFQGKTMPEKTEVAAASRTINETFSHNSGTEWS
jgi:hypothetical protein